MPRSLKQRIEALEKQNKDLKKSLADAVKQLKANQKVDRNKMNAIEKRVNRYSYVKAVRLVVPSNGTTVSKPLIPTSQGFAVLGEVMGKFEGRGERVWIGTKKLRNVNYWYLFGHSRQPHVAATAFVFKYPRAP